MPLHKHDCSDCIRLGTAKGCDIYVHIDPNREDLSTVIVRYSSDGPDYDSCKLFYLRRDVSRKQPVWLYALGLYDGYQRFLQDELAKHGVAVAADLAR